MGVVEKRVVGMNFGRCYYIDVRYAPFISVYNCFGNGDFRCKRGLTYVLLLEMYLALTCLTGGKAPLLLLQRISSSFLLNLKVYDPLL